jgi:hypothetical protein
MNETSSDQDKPLTSAEMIRQAREGFTQPLSPPDSGSIDREAIEKQIEAEMPKITATYTAPRTSRRPMQRAARRSDTPAGFGGPTVGQRSGALAIAITAALVILGIAVLLAVASSSGGLQ